MLTPKELCERIKVAPDTLSKWRTMRRNGDKIGPPFVVLGGGDPRGGGIRYRIADVLEWEASLTDGEAA